MDRNPVVRRNRRIVMITITLLLMSACARVECVPSGRIIFSSEYMIQAKNGAIDGSILVISCTWSTNGYR